MFCTRRASSAECPNAPSRKVAVPGWYAVILGAILLQAGATEGSTGPSFQVDLGRSDPLGKGAWKSLQIWQLEDAKKLGGAKSLTEVWPSNGAGRPGWAGRKSEWKGVLLGDLVQKSLDQLTVDERAQVDLIVLHAGQGDARALIPRALLKKFPFLLAWSREGRSTDAWVAIPPKASRQKIQSESVPLDSYFLDGVGRIELASSQVRFRSSLLQRRTDPIAMRGEKLFLSSCLGCHESGRAPALTAAAQDRFSRWSTRQFMPAHSKVGGVPSVSERDWGSLRSYWEAFRSESMEALTPPQSARGAEGAAALPVGTKARDQG